MKTPGRRSSLLPRHPAVLLGALVFMGTALLLRPNHTAAAQEHPLGDTVFLFHPFSDSPYISYLFASPPHRTGRSGFDLVTGKKALPLFAADGLTLLSADLEILPLTAALEFDLERLPAEERPQAPPADALWLADGEWLFLFQEGTWIRYRQPGGIIEKGKIPLPRDTEILLGGPHSVIMKSGGTLYRRPLPKTEIPKADITGPAPFEEEKLTLSGFPGAFAVRSPSISPPDPEGPPLLAAVADSAAPRISLITFSEPSPEVTEIRLSRQALPGPIQDLCFLSEDLLLAGGTSPAGGFLTLISLKTANPPATAEPPRYKLLTPEGERPLPFSLALSPFNEGKPVILNHPEEGLYLPRRRGAEKTESRERGSDIPWEYQFCRAALLTARREAQPADTGESPLPAARLHLTRSQHLLRADQMLSWIEGFLREKRSRNPLDPLWSDLLEELLVEKKEIRSALEDLPTG